MPVNIPPPQRRTLLHTEKLCQEAFSVFGDVIENPSPNLVPSPSLKDIPKGAVLGNQGSALVYSEITKTTNFYDVAPSGQASKHAMRMFSCAPRKLLPVQNESVDGLLEVVILERHPYTAQTFIPLGLSAADAKDSRYLVIVAPTLAPSSLDAELPTPSADGSRGRGLPDIANLKAFVANGSQAVTYGAGTWHAPMIVVGKRPIDFIVVQSVNGVGIEDCQEAEWKSEKGKEVVVAVTKNERQQAMSKL